MPRKWDHQNCLKTPCLVSGTTLVRKIRREYQAATNTVQIQMQQIQTGLNSQKIQKVPQEIEKIHLHTCVIAAWYYLQIFF